MPETTTPSSHSTKSLSGKAALLLVLGFSIAVAVTTNGIYVFVTSRQEAPPAEHVVRKPSMAQLKLVLEADTSLKDLLDQCEIRATATNQNTGSSTDISAALKIEGGSLMLDGMPQGTYNLSLSIKLPDGRIQKAETTHVQTTFPAEIILKLQ